MPVKDKAAKDKAAKDKAAKDKAAKDKAAKDKAAKEKAAIIKAAKEKAAELLNEIEKLRTHSAQLSFIEATELQNEINRLQNVSREITRISSGNGKTGNGPADEYQDLRNRIQVLENTRLRDILIRLLLEHDYQIS